MFSTFAVETLRAGDVLELMTPTGSFGAPLDPLARRDYVAVAAGSGITPILSIMGTTMEIETESRFTLFYGNRTAESTMFATELDELEARYADRLRIFHTRSAEATTPPLFAAVSTWRWFNACPPATSLDRPVVPMRPSDLVTTMRDDLASEGVPTERIHLELFRGTNRPTHVDDFPKSGVTITLSGADHTVELAAGETVLESALKNNIDAPYACLGGAVALAKPGSQQEQYRWSRTLHLTQPIEAGFILTCQSHPTTPTVAVDYDS
jgi:Flavodoxin reductases (ferredoxin-NADPH reductases) family 1